MWEVTGFAVLKNDLWSGMAQFYTTVTSCSAVDVWVLVK